MKIFFSLALSLTAITAQAAYVTTTGLNVATNAAVAMATNNAKAYVNGAPVFGAASATSINSTNVTDASSAAFWGATGNGSTDDKTFLISAFNYNMARTNGVVTLPRGTFLVNVSAAETAFTLTNDIRIVGAGKDATIIQMGPDTSPADNTILFAISSGKKVSFENITLQAPSTNGTYASTTPIRTGVILNDGANPVSGTVTFKDASVIGFDNCVKMDGPISGGTLSTGLLQGNRSTFIGSGRGSAIVHNGGELQFVSCVASNRNIGQTSLRHVIYSAVHVSMNFLGGEIAGSGGGGYGVHHFGGSAIAPRYCQYVNTVFSGTFASGNAAILTATSADTFIDNCVFTNTAGAAVFMTGSTIVRGCRSSSNIEVSNSGGPSNKTYIVRDSIIDASVLFGSASAGSVLTVENCRITPTSTVGVFINVPGTLIVRNCRMLGTAASSAHIYTSDGTVKAEGNYINNTSGSPGISVSGTVTIFGQENEFATGTGSAMIISSSWTGKGHMQFRHGLNPTVVASVSSITPNANYDVHHVSGTTTINNVLVDGSSADVGLFNGTFNFIADDQWALGTSGNILPSSTSARSTNEVVTLLYDQTTAKWIEKSRPGIATTWTNMISGVITQRLTTIGGIVVTNLTL